MSQQSTWTPSAGTVIDGRYEIQQEIGKGGLARVWQARDNRTGEEVAIKHIYYESDNYGRAPDKVEEMFQNEIDVLEQVKQAGGHENIIALHDIVTKRQTQMAVVEHVQGKELDDEDLSVSEDEARQITIELADAMGFLHRNEIIYRDLKPDNAMVQPNDSPILIDFNTAKPFDTEGVNAALECPNCGTDLGELDAVCPDCGKDLQGSAGTVVGTDASPYYPPESYENKKHFRQGPWSDVYSLGRIFMRLLLGSNRALPKKDGRGPQDFGMSCRDYNNAIIKRATATDPGERYNNARVLQKVLEQRDPEPPTEGILTHQQTGKRYRISPGDTIGRAGASGPSATITLPDPQGEHISAVQLQLDIKDDTWIVRDQSLNGTYVQRGNGWERVLCETGRRRLRNKGHDPTDRHGNVPPEELPIEDGSLIALVDPSYGVSFTFEEAF